MKAAKRWSALNSYEGCVILVVMMHIWLKWLHCLWLVDGHVSAFDGDVTDCKKWLLAKRAVPHVNADKPTTKPVDKQLSTRRYKNQRCAKIRSCEKDLETLVRKTSHETKCPPGFYDPSMRNIAALGETCPHRRQLSAVEEAWLLHQEELEQVTQLGMINLGWAFIFYPCRTLSIWSK